MVLCLSVYLPGLGTIPPIDRDESRFAQASRQMFEAAVLPESQKTTAFHDGGWAIPKVQDRPRLNKPPMVYWLQVASAWVCTGGNPLGDAIWMYRIPGVLCATIAVLLTWRTGLTMFGPRTAWLAGAMLAVCPVVVFDAHQARADQLLLATVAAMQCCLWERWRTRAPAPRPARPDLAWTFGFWACMGLSVLAKGPIGPMIAVLTCTALAFAARRLPGAPGTVLAWLKSLRPAIGLLIVTSCVLPWIWIVADQIGWRSYLGTVYDETLGRSVEAKEGHWAPPGYHTLLSAVLFWPGSVMTALAIQRAWRAGFPPAIREARPARPVPGAKESPLGRIWSGLLDRRAGRSAEVFCLAWILPAWVVFELIGTKLPHYTLPMYPALALLSARMLVTASRAGAVRVFSRLDRFGFGAWWVLGLALPVLVIAALLSSATSGGPVNGVSIAGMAIAIAALAAAWRIRLSAAHTPSVRTCLTMMMVAVVTWGMFFQFIAPQVLPGSATPRLVQVIRDQGLWDCQLASEYHEDSLIFATRGRVERLDRSATPAWLAAAPDRVAIVRSSGPPFFGDSSDQVARPYHVIGAVPTLLGPSWTVLTLETEGSPKQAHPR